MRKINNLNQLLSRVKSIFGRKATPSTTVPPNAEPPTDLSVVSDPRLRAAFADIEKYLTENYGTPTDKLSYQDYANGASLFSKDAVFAPSLVILTDSDGLYNLPDNVLLLVTVTSTKDENCLIEELGKFILFLKELGSTQRIHAYLTGSFILHRGWTIRTALLYFIFLIVLLSFRLTFSFSS